MEPLQYHEAAPYPIPKALQPNRCYARILLQNFSGPTSELTAVTQYVYHHLAAGDSPRISGILRGIAVVEMRHLDMLGGCIRQLGLKPKYRHFQGNAPRCWNAGYVHYGNTIRDMIQEDIQGEHAAIRQYEAAVRSIEEPQIQALIRRIIQDEQLHIKLFQSLLKEL